MQSEPTMHIGRQPGHRSIYATALIKLGVADVGDMLFAAASITGELDSLTLVPLHIYF